MTRRRRERRQQGFTLLEVMVTMAILVFMLTIAWSVTSGTATAKRNTESRQLRNHELRVAMARMVSDLSTAYLSANEDQNLLERRTLFVGKDAGEIGELRFSSLAHVSLWADANESEQTQIAYYSERDREDSSKTNLLRRESRRLSNEPWKGEPADVDVLLSDVDKVTFEYFDFRDKEWKSAWDSAAGDSQRDRLPLRVRITVEVAVGDEKVKYTTQARINLQESLRFFTN